MERAEKHAAAAAEQLGWLATARSEVARIKATATGASENLNAAATALTQPTLKLPRPAPRLHVSRRSWQSVQAAPNVCDCSSGARDEGQRMRRKPRQRLITASSRRWRRPSVTVTPKDRVWQRGAPWSRRQPRLKWVASERKRVTAALEAAAVACRGGESHAIVARRERDDARAESEAVAHTHQRSPPREDARRPRSSAEPAGWRARADTARLEAELADAAVEVESRPTDAILANDNDSTDSEALELQLELRGNAEVADAALAEEAAAAPRLERQPRAARDAALVEATARASRAVEAERAAPPQQRTQTAFRRARGVPTGNATPSRWRRPRIGAAVETAQTEISRIRLTARA